MCISAGYEALAANGKATNLFNGVHTAERNVVKRTSRGIWRINDLRVATGNRNTLAEWTSCRTAI